MAQQQLQTIDNQVTWARVWRFYGSFFWRFSVLLILTICAFAAYFFITRKTSGIFSSSVLDVTIFVVILFVVLGLIGIAGSYNIFLRCLYFPDRDFNLSFSGNTEPQIKKQKLSLWWGWTWRITVFSISVNVIIYMLNKEIIPLYYSPAINFFNEIFQFIIPVYILKKLFENPKFGVRIELLNKEEQKPA